MATLLIKNIGEFFTGDLAKPQLPVQSLLIKDKSIAAFDPPADTKADAVLDAGNSAVMPGLVDGHVHPVFGEWTPTQDTIGWIGNYVHGGTTTMVSASELHVPGLDYENLTPDLVTSLAVVTASTTGRVRWSGGRWRRTWRAARRRCGRGCTRCGMRTGRGGGGRGGGGWGR